GLFDAPWLLWVLCFGALVVWVACFCLPLPAPLPAPLPFHLWGDLVVWLLFLLGCFFFGALSLLLMASLF
ncbi:MAG: hypothetical protein K8963_09165, partial [Proteobacteria bacterium]|nr:hypothetical protein [Pseudomonadota bacterium]